MSDEARTVLNMWGLHARPARKRKRTHVSSSVTIAAKHSPTSILRTSRGGDRRLSFFQKTRRDGSRRILPSCRSYCFAKATGPLSSVPGGPFVANGGLELLLFCGIALHVK